MLDQTWTAFAKVNRERLEAWSHENNGGKPIRASTPVDAADTWNILEGFVGSPEAWAAGRLFDEVGSSGRVVERLAEFATFWDGAPGMVQAIMLEDDAAIAGFQRVLDEEGFSRIRLKRDDEFFSRVYPRLKP
jgi:hypothetical protein